MENINNCNFFGYISHAKLLIYILMIEDYLICKWYSLIISSLLNMVPYNSAYDINIRQKNQKKTINSFFFPSFHRVDSWCVGKSDLRQAFVWEIHLWYNFPSKQPKCVPVSKHKSSSAVMFKSGNSKYLWDDGKQM